MESHSEPHQEAFHMKVESSDGGTLNISSTITLLLLVTVYEVTDETFIRSPLSLNCLVMQWLVSGSDEYHHPQPHWPLSHRKQLTIIEAIFAMECKFIVPNLIILYFIYMSSCSWIRLSIFPKLILCKLNMATLKLTVTHALDSLISNTYCFPTPSNGKPSWAPSRSFPHEGGEFGWWNINYNTWWHWIRVAKQ